MRSLHGNSVLGTIRPARGAAMGLRLETNTLEPNKPVLSWDWLVPDDDHTDKTLKIFNNSALEQTSVDEENYILATVIPNSILNVDAISVSPSDQNQTPVVYHLPLGSRVSLTWTKNTDADFNAYNIYYDNKTGTSDILLKKLYGADNTTLITGSLTDGTYKFKIEYQDTVGNATTGATEYTATINVLPPESSVTFAWVAGSGLSVKYVNTSLPDDIATMNIYSNHLNPVGFYDYPILEHDMRIAELSSGATSTLIPWQRFTSGNYQFCGRWSDSVGNEGAYTVYPINLKYSGATLAVGAAAPVTPFLSASAIADAKISLTWTMTSTTDVASYKIYLGSTYTAGTTSTLYEYSGVHGGTYNFYVSALNTDNIESALSNLQYVTADGTAPTGSRSLTLQVVT